MFPLTSKLILSYYQMMKYLSVVMLCLLCACTSCNQPAANKHNVQPQPGIQSHSQNQHQAKKIGDSAPEPKESFVKNSWLTVKKINKNRSAKIATGTFNVKRNKIMITTNNAEQFAIDTSRIPINWRRPVVLSINGRNSELKKRGYSIIHFKHDKYGQWSVVEP